MFSLIGWKEEVASLRDAYCMLIINHRTALRLYGVIKIKPLRGLDNHCDDI